MALHNGAASWSCAKRQTPAAGDETCILLSRYTWLAGSQRPWPASWLASEAGCLAGWLAAGVGWQSGYKADWLTGWLAQLAGGAGGLAGGAGWLVSGIAPPRLSPITIFQHVQIMLRYAGCSQKEHLSPAGFTGRLCFAVPCMSVCTYVLYGVFVMSQSFRPAYFNHVLAYKSSPTCRDRLATVGLNTGRT